MTNRSIVLTAVLSWLGCGGLACTALAQNSDPVRVVNTPSVNVVNPTTNPVPITGTVTDAENPARQAVQHGFNIVLTGTLQGSSSINIPAGKIFVLETVSLLANGPLDFVFITVHGTDITGGPGAVDYSLLIPPANAAGITSSSQALRVYAQPGTPLTVNVMLTTTNPSSSFLTSVTLSGFFVNAQ